MTKKVLPCNCRGVCVKRLGNHGGARRGDFRHYNAFTLIELVVVFGLILVLTGLVLSTVGYARKKGARARAETEIAAMSAACESYKADNGTYPTTAYTNSLDPKTNGNPGSTPCPSPCPDPGAVTAYSQASFDLYTLLSGDLNGNRQIDAGETGKSYMAFQPKMLLPAGGTGIVTAISDPFGYSYGYSTAFQHDLEQGLSPTHGYNPTFDLWSTSGLTTTPPTAPITQQWIKNW
jgi:type II secretory pathway pseudopilin PulG